MRNILTILVCTLCVVGSNIASAQRWEKATLPAPYDRGYYLDIYFLPSDQNYGWACDQNGGYVVRTVDGGRTWQGSSVRAAAGACHLEYIQFLDRNVGYCSGPCGMYKSVDGGATWQDIKPAGSPGVWGGWFRNANEGWFTGGGCGYNYFMKTMDGGATFQTYLDTNEKRSAMADPYWDASMPANTLYAIGSGTLWRSQTDGANWQVLAYTGTSSPWHEELAMYGNAVCIPMGGTKCTNTPGLNDGMRFSPDLGQSWREFGSGQPMFGTCLLDATKGWAAGMNAAVYYTSNAGQSWQLRNCGLEGANMDDIFFLNNNDGWVAGVGLFRTAPPQRTQNKILMRFNSVCPDSAKRDTVSVRNINWFASPWTAVISGPDAANFRIVNAPISATIASCTQQPVIVEYRPLSAGAHNAVLTIQIQQPDTTLVVTLEGDRRARVAYPIDTLVTFTTRVGTPVDRTLVWRSSAALNLESIIAITRVSGDTNIRLTTSQLPAVVLPGTTLSYIYATVRDTGWTQARFRVRLGPCIRDTFITVRIYGVSPIFNSIVNSTVHGQCKDVDTIRIPISNTGNAPLIVRSMVAANAGVQAFVVLRFVSGRFGAPWTFAPGDKDTALIEYRRQSGNDNATLVIENDDITLARGPKTPWQIGLRGTSTIPSIAITPKVIDVGSVCTGTSLDKSFDISNVGTATASLSLSTSSRDISGLTVGNVTMLAGQRRTIRFSYTARKQGPINDTIALRLTPCDAMEYVVVKGLVEDLALSITPSSVVDSADVNVTINKRFVVRLTAGDNATIRSIRVAPLPSAMRTGIPPFPFVLSKQDSIVVTVSWSSPVPIEYRGVLEVEAITTCSTLGSADIYFRALSTDLSVGPSELRWLQQCTPREQVDSAYIDVKGGRAVNLLRATIRESGTPFRVVSPNWPITMQPGTRHWVIVAYQPLVAGVNTATLDIATDAQGGNFAIPLQGRLDVPIVRARPQTIDFGAVEACQPMQSIRVMFSNIGTIDADVDMALSAGSRGIQVTPTTINMPASDSTPVSVEVDPSQLVPGRTRAVMVFTDRRCGTRDSVVISVDLIPSDRLTLSPDPLDLGTLEPTQTATGTVTIGNAGLTPRRISDLRIEPANMPWRILTNVIGTDVSGASNIPVDLEFAPTAEGTYNAQLVLVDVGQCTTTSVIQLRGRAKDPRVPPMFTLNLRMDGYTVQPAAHVSVPIHWESNISDALVDSLRTVVTFDRLTYVVDSVSAGTMEDVGVAFDIQADYVRFLLKATGPNAGRPGVVAVLHGTARQALPDSTALSFTQTTIWATEAVNVLTKNGFIIVDACGPRFLIRHNAMPVFRLHPPVPVRETIVIGVQSYYADIARVEIINSTGQIVQTTENIAIAIGTSTVSCNVSGLSSGVYGVRVTSASGGTFTASVPVVR